MGALHAGHAALFSAASAENGHVLASVFVNPTQFDHAADLERYPRTLEADLAVAAAHGVDAVFAPSPESLYPTETNALHVSLPHLQGLLEGASRPGHFDGVALVVAKLLCLTQPTRAYFGQKDFQQTVVIKQLVAELLMPVEVVVVPTVREADGLALSSRNRFLSTEERTVAPQLYHALEAAARASSPGSAAIVALHAFDRALAASPAFKLDYAAVVSGHTLAPVETLLPEDDPVLVTAARLGSVRLLDNARLLR